jgi:hypothetical protein
MRYPAETALRGHRMRFDHLKRRAFILLLGGAAVWPFAAHAQQMRRVGMLSPWVADDRQGQAKRGSISARDA